MGVLRAGVIKPHLAAAAGLDTVQATITDGSDLTCTTSTGGDTGTDLRLVSELECQDYPGGERKAREGLRV